MSRLWRRYLQVEVDIFFEDLVASAFDLDVKDVVARVRQVDFVDHLSEEQVLGLGLFLVKP